MFSMVQEMIISEYWTVNYCSYLVEQLSRIYPEENYRIKHLMKNLKILEDKNGEEEREVSQLYYEVTQGKTLEDL